MGKCHKIFVNVLASSREEPDAVVCCALSLEEGEEESNISSLLGLCTKPQHLPFFRRLSKFPDALLIPLFPLMMRIAVRTYQTVMESGYVMLDTTFGVHSFRRLVFYFLLMQFRGWFLYLALNGIEDYYLTDQPPYHGTRHNSNGTEACWFNEWLHEAQHSCHGRVFDFSDHVVLYYAQLLPIAFLEYLHSLDRPYWPFHRFALPFVLTVCMLYLYFITFVGVYKTAAYFHTPGECLIGYGISLLSHIPLCMLQCTNERECVMNLRQFFFGSKMKSVYH